jgi:ribonuclease HII
MICGVDEAGRGPVIGPLVVCGVSIEGDEVLRKMGVRDSKKLSRSKREDLSEKIRMVVSGVEIVEVGASDIDLLREEMTLNQLETKVFASIIKKLNPEIAYVDAADVDEERFAKEICDEIGCKMNIVSKHKADDTYPVVSAASILAKVRRDALVLSIEDEIGEPIGSGYASDPVTIRFIESWLARHESLPPHTRKSWDTSSRLLNLRAIKKLDRY